MSNKNEVVPPLVLVQTFTNKYPGVWDRIDLLREKTLQGEIDARWDFDLCYCPISVAMGALSSFGPLQQISGPAGAVAACAAWRRMKMIYRFDTDLANELIAMADDIVIPVEAFRSLPAPAVYIQFEEPNGEIPLPGGKSTMLDGFLVHIEDDINTHEKELRINYLTVAGDPVYAVIIHLIPGGTISDGIEKAVQVSLDNLHRTSLSPAMKELSIRSIRESKGIAMQAAQLVLYICADNAEIKGNDTQAKIYRKSDRITDRYRELRKWDVGVKTGTILRAARKRDQEESTDPVLSETPGKNYTRIHKARPHVRRAHWHHYWTGSAANKKLILRWVNTMLINADGEELPPTVIPLK